MLAKHEVSIKTAKDLAALMEKVKGRIEKAKAPKQPKPSNPSSETDASGQPEAKKRKDMSEEEKRDFDTYLAEIKIKRQELIEKRSARHFRKQQLAKRRTAASQERMRIISQLAKNTKKEDNFGMNDDDWDVYKKIRKDTGDSDSEEEQEKLAEFESILRENDLLDQEIEDEISRDSPEWYQLHLSTERIRVPEIFFQPSIVGCDQAGISEALDFILNKYDSQTSGELAANVFVTGAPARLPGLVDRIASDLVSNRPFGSVSNVRVAAHPTMDAFRGMQAFAQDHLDHQDFWISKAEYEESGLNIFKRHSCSNVV